MVKKRLLVLLIGLVILSSFIVTAATIVTDDEVIDLRSPFVINVNTGAGGAADGNASSICTGDEILLGNSSCLSAATLVSGGGGDITAVNAGTGLFGGGLSGDVTLNVSSETCSAGQVSQYNGTGFVCVTDDTSAGVGFTTDQNDELNTTGQPTFDNLTINNNLTVLDRFFAVQLAAQTYFTTGSDKRFNFYDDGTDIFLNVSNGGGDFTIQQFGSEIHLHNPGAANNFEVFHIFSKQATTVSEFVVTQAGEARASYFIRSLALTGNSTDTPIPFNCSTYADFIDCQTDLTGPDLYVMDDVEIDGRISLANNLINTTDDGNISAVFYFGDGSTLSNLPSAAADGNASSFCEGDEVLLGNETCLNSTVFFDNTNIENNGITLLEANITDLTHTVNESTRFGNLVASPCTGTDKATGVFLNGSMNCSTDLTTAGDGFTTDQNDELNTTGNPIFNVLNVSRIFSTDWLNVTVTESQVTDLVHTVNETVRFEALIVNNCVAGTVMEGVFPNGTVDCIADISGNGFTTDQNDALNTTGAPTFATVNTGQGANELFVMNQDVNTTANVAFNNITSIDCITFDSGGKICSGA